MSFYTFMMRQYKNSNTPAGDLAGDMKRDTENFPRNPSCKYRGWYDIIRDYLMRKGACDTCLEIFDECWEEYVRCEKEKKKLKRN